MSEVPRWLELVAERDHALWRLGLIAEYLSASAPRTALDAMIDEATGADQVDPAVQAEADELMARVDEICAELEALDA